MAILQYGLVLLIAGAVILTYILMKKNSKNVELLVRILAISVAVIFFVRYMSGDDAISAIYQLKSFVFETPFENFVSLILNWILNANILLIAIGTFFNNVTVKNIIKFFTLPTTILIIVALIPVSVGIVGVEGYAAFNFRAILMAIEIGIVLSYSILTWIKNSSFKLSKGDALKLFFILPMLLAIMPSYMIQGLFGYAETLMEVKSFTVLHRIVLYISLILPVVIFFTLYKKSYETKKLCLLYIAFGTLISFSLGHKFATFLDVTAWPFHLCNTAMYIVPICILFKWDKLFYFTYFINILGAFLAMAMPNYSAETNLFAMRLVNFYINHYIAFFMPIIMVSLKLYERPRLKTFMYSMVGFGIYFLLVLILNAWFSNYGTVDYFFINSDFIADKLGSWAENLRDTTLAFNIGELKFVFYPVYQVLFFLGYVALGFGMWFIFEQGYAFADMMKDITERNKKIKADWLALQAMKKERGEDMKVVDLSNVETKIELKNFSKRYGSSKHFAVKDANLEINGGEVFGFLGHNGAGKSTIIKSIVGIQPITSGNIEVCGFDVDKEPVVAKRLIGFVPDHYALYEKLTGREYLNYIADLWNVSSEDREKSISKYVKLFEMETAMDNQIKTYSHGMKQKITIMSALVHNPKVWILDEPLTGLDPTSIFQVKKCMKEHAKAGNIVFFSSHLIDVVESVCDRIAIIKKGHILTTKSLEEIEKECSLEDYYLKITSTEIEAEKAEDIETSNNEPEKLPKKKKEKKVKAGN